MTTKCFKDIKKHSLFRFTFALVCFYLPTYLPTYASLLLWSVFAFLPILHFRISFFLWVKMAKWTNLTWLYLTLFSYVIIFLFISSFLLSLSLSFYSKFRASDVVKVLKSRSMKNVDTSRQTRARERSINRQRRHTYKGYKECGMSIGTKGEESNR